MKHGLFTGMLVLLALLPLPSFAQSCNNADNLRVGIVHSPPFIVRDATGNWSGLALELWQHLATELKLDYQLCDQSFEGSPLNVSNALVQIQQQQLDVALGALTITSAREKAGDFSLPFFHTGLSIATREDSHSWAELWQWATRPTSLMVVIFLVVMAPMLTLLFRKLERNHGQELLEGPKGRSFATTMLWVTLVCTGRAGAFDMKSFSARILATLLSFIGVTVLASIVALATSSTVISNLDKQMKTLADLTTHRVAVIEGTSTRDFLDNHGIRANAMSDLDSALKALMADRVDAVVHDRPTLQYAIHQLPADERPALQSKLLNEEYYGLYLQQQSPLREKINQALPQTLTTDNWQRTLHRYLGAQH